MSDIDNLTGLVISAGAVVNPNYPAQNENPTVWDIAAKPANKTKFTVHIDMNAGYWTIYPASAAYPITRGQNSPELERQMRRFGML
jgi:hypothetical protein